MSDHCGHWVFNQYDKTGYEECCKCQEGWPEDQYPPETDCITVELQ